MFSSTPLKHIFFILLLPSIIFASVGKITVSSGDVSVQRAGKIIKGVSNTPLEEKDAIFTKAGSSVQIILSDGTALSLGANTNLKIQEYLFDEKAKNANLKVGVAEGAFRSITGKIGKISPEKFKVETRTATIGIRGTTFLGVIPKEGPETIVCTRGVISVTPNPVQIPGAPTAPKPVVVVVKAGEITKASVGTVEPPRPYTKAELQNLEKAITVDSKKSDAAPAVTSSEEKKADSNDKNPNGGGDRGVSQVSTIATEFSLESIKKSVESTIKDIVDAKNSEKAEPQTRQAQTTSETTTTATVTDTQESSATPSALASAKARGDVYTLGKALLSKDSTQQSEAASLIAAVPTSSPSSYTVLSSANSQLLNNALRVTYGASTKYFKYSGNANTYGTDETFGSIGELLADLQTFTGSNVKFYLDPATNKISYGVASGASLFTLGKVDQATDFLGFANTPIMQAATMASTKYYNKAATLTDGSVVTVDGNTVEQYNPTTNTWTTKTPLLQNRGTGALTAIGGGKFLTMGGGWGAGTYQNNIEIYDPSGAGSSTLYNTDTGAVNIATVAFRDHFSAVTLYDGKVMMMGGHDVTENPSSGGTVFTGGGTIFFDSYLIDPASLSTSSADYGIVRKANMTTTRFSYGATVLNDGKTVLAIGGRDGAIVLSSAEKYYYANTGETTGVWTNIASMPIPAFGLSTVTTSDNKVLAFGGSNTVSTRNILEYNPVGDVWKYKTPLPFTFAYGAAATLNDGSVLLVGGHQDGVASANSYIYTPSAASSVVPTTGNLQYSRVGLAMTKLLDGTVFAVGGFNYDQIDHTWVPEQIYNPATGQWTTPASTNNPSTGTYSRIGLGAATLSSGKVLIAGGNDGWGWNFANVDSYDLATHTWATLTSLPETRSWLGLVSINGGANALAIGGTDGTASLASVLRFDPTANSGLGSWTLVAPMNTARNAMGVVALQDGNVLVMGGGNGGGLLNSVEYYNVAGDAWTYRANMLTPKSTFSATLLQDGSVLAIGGYSAGSTPLSSIEQYNPSTDIWQYKVPLPFTLTDSSAVTLNDGSVLISAGKQNGVASASSWIYNPGQTISSNINTILAKDYNAGVNNGFFIGSTSNMGSAVFGSIDSMLFGSEPSAAGIDVNTNSGQLNGALGSMSGVSGVSAFNFANYTTPTTSMVNYSGEDNKIIWGEAVVDSKSSTIGFASLPDKVNSDNSLASVDDFSSWGYWEAMSTDGTQYHSGYWVSGQPTSVEYINQMVAQKQTYSYSGHVIGDTLNASSIKDAIVLDVNNKIDMSVKFGSANPITVTALKFSTSQGWSYNQSTNLTNTSSAVSGNGYTAALGNSVNTSDALNMQGKFYGPQANSTGGAFAGNLTGADATQRAVQGVYKARR